MNNNLGDKLMNFRSNPKDFMSIKYWEIYDKGYQQPFDLVSIITQIYAQKYIENDNEDHEKLRNFLTD